METNVLEKCKYFAFFCAKEFSGSLYPWMVEMRHLSKRTEVLNNQKIKELLFPNLWRIDPLTIRKCLKYNCYTTVS